MPHNSCVTLRCDMVQPDDAIRPAGELDELTLEIRRVIEENRTFLDRMMDDGFEEDEMPEDEDVSDVEL